MLRSLRNTFTRAIRTMATTPTPAASAESVSPPAPALPSSNAPEVTEEKSEVKFEMPEITKAQTPPPRSPSPAKEIHLQGLFAVNKPSGITSFDVIRQLRNTMNASPIFRPLLLHERSLRLSDVNSQRSRKAKHNKLELKMGHGGTLDPMANGVLVLGVGTGTKQLQNFLMGTKEYVAKAIFGCETDTYDAEGSIVHKSPYSHITREKVEEVLERFRGDIQQIPPIYSALRVNGVRFYEYARRGEKPPVEIQPRPVTCSHLELLDYTTEHDFKYPTKFLKAEEKENAEIVLSAAAEAKDAVTEGKPSASVDTAETPAPTTTESTETTGPSASTDTVETPAPTATESIETTETPAPATTEPSDSTKAASPSPVASLSSILNRPDPTSFDPASPPPVITIKMDVSSGFYVRSLIHHIGVALGSSAHMVTLTRTRQSQYAIGKNAIEWENFQEVEKWTPLVRDELLAYMKKEEEEGGPKKYVQVQQRQGGAQGNYQGKPGFKRDSGKRKFQGGHQGGEKNQKTE